MIYQMYINADKALKIARIASPAITSAGLNDAAWKGFDVGHGCRIDQRVGPMSIVYLELSGSADNVRSILSHARGDFCEYCGKHRPNEPSN